MRLKLSKLVTDAVEALFSPMFPPLPQPPLYGPEPVPPAPRHQTDRALKNVLSDIKDVQAEQIEQMLALYGEVSGLSDADMEQIS